MAVAVTTTVTVNDPPLPLPAASVAVQVMVVVPSGKVPPDARLQTSAGEASTASAEVTV